MKDSESVMRRIGATNHVGERQPINKWPKRYHSIKTDFAVFAIDELAYGPLRKTAFATKLNLGDTLPANRITEI